MTAAPAFDAIADRYDNLFTESVIGRAQRQIVWRELGRVLAPGQRVLEINCGTGVDAVFMAERGVAVDACDVSPRMISVACRRVQESAQSLPVNFFVHDIERLDQLDGAYDGVLSNFGGLNCVADMRAAGSQLARLVRRGGFLMVCLAGRFCGWELLWYGAQRRYGKALRRIRGRADGDVNGNKVPVYYRTARELAGNFAPWFRVVRRRGVGVLVPPTYVERFAVRHPRLFARAVKLDGYLSCLPLARAAADHMLLVMERTEA